MFRPEFQYVEKLLLDQLHKSGWLYKYGKELAPVTSDGRSSLKEVVLTYKLETAINGFLIELGYE